MTTPRVALDLADWSPVRDRADITVFDRHLSEDEAVEALRSFDVVCTLRERMAFPRTLIERLPNLKVITIVGMSLPNLDMAAASERGVLVVHSNFANPDSPPSATPPPELAWGLMIATGAQPGRRTSAHARGRVADDDRSDPVRQDAWPSRPRQDRQTHDRIRAGVWDGGYRLESES